MANVVNSTAEVTGSRNVIVKWDGILDTALETNVKKFDVSTYTNGEKAVASTANIIKVWYDIGVGVDTLSLLFDATGNDEALILSPGNGFMDFSSFGGIKNPKSAGYTGDILMTNTGTVGTDFSYNIVAELRLKY